MTDYPKFMYHKTEAPDGKLVHSADEEKALGTGWVNTPAKFDPNYVAPPPAPESDIPEDARQAGFVPTAYPAHRFRKNDADHSKIVASLEEDLALEKAEPGVWKETPDPAAWDPKPKKGSKPSAPAAAPPAANTENVPPVPPAPVAPPPNAPVPAALSKAQVAEFKKATVAQLAERIEGIADGAMIDALLVAEQGSDAPRKTVVKALEARRKALLAPVS